MKSASIRAAITQAVGGLGFAVGSLLLARAMDPAGFAWLALIIALSQVAYGIGPFGAETVIGRYAVDADRRLLGRALATSGAAAVALTAVGGAYYDIPAALLAPTLALCLAISLNRVSAAVYRGQKQFGPALFLIQAHNLALAVIAAAALAAGVRSPLVIAWVITALYVLSAAWSWARLMHRPRAAIATAYGSVPWQESFAVLAAGAAVVVFIQLERLVIPPLLGTEALATYAVLAAVVGAPYRVLQMAVGFTLLPTLRQAPTAADRRRIMRREAALMGAVVAAGSVVLWFLAPVLFDLFLGDKYRIGAALVAAGIIAGCAKVGAALGQALVTAVASSRELEFVGLVAWLCVGIGVAGAVIGAQWGFNGIIYGVTAGWLCYLAATTFLAFRHGQGRADPPP